MIFKIENLKISTKIILGFLFITIPTIIMGVVSLISLQQGLIPINKIIPENAVKLANEARLSNLSQFIRYYDETLTQSARNYAFTGDEKWKNRYNQDVIKLDVVIKEAIDTGDQKDKDLFSVIDSANVSLVNMEASAINFTDIKKNTEAIKILESKEYWDQKTIYQNGLDAYITHKGIDYDQAFSKSSSVLEKATSDSRNILTITIFIVIIGTILNIIVAIFLGFFISKIIADPIKDLKNTAMNIAKGKEDIRNSINSKDEVGELAQVFNFMADRLHDSKVNIEKKVLERTAQLEKLNSFMAGREIKMAELKKKIIELEAKNKK